MSKQLSKTMQALVEEMQIKGFAYMTEADRAKIEAVGYELETNPAMTLDGDPDFVATRLKVYSDDDSTGSNSESVDPPKDVVHNSVIASNNTEAQQQTQTAAPAQPKPQGNKTMFNIATVDIATVPAAPRASAKYPFEQLEVGQSFFVPNSHSNKGDAKKTLASTVSGMNTKYSRIVEGQTRMLRGKEVPVREAIRKFETRGVQDGAQWGAEGEAGVAVIRVL